MKASNVRLGGFYRARVDGRYTTVRVDMIETTLEGKTVWHITDMRNNVVHTFHSAAKFKEDLTPKHQPPQSDASKIATQQYNEELEQWEVGADLDPIDVPGVEMTLGTVDALTPSSDLVTAASPVTEELDKLSGRLAARIATTLAVPSNIPADAKLTAQQRAILEMAQRIQQVMAGAGVDSDIRQVDGQWVLVIGAGAGTGKTYTLKQLEMVLRGNIQYTAFNTALVAESRVKFVKAKCNTTHSLAFGEVGKLYSHRLNSNRVKSWQIAQMIGLGDYTIQGEPYPVDSYEWCEAVLAAGYDDELNLPPDDFKPCPVRTLKAQWLAGRLVDAVKRFCQSADREISGKHIWDLSGLDTQGSHKNTDAVRAYLEPFLKKMWADLADINGTLPFTHDCYVKIWQLGEGDKRPIIAADVILLDEGQDTAPVMLDIIAQQKHALVIIVGDDNQAIYEWRGAVNALAYFKGAPRLLLSQSFRFGQSVADVANSILATLEEPTDLVMEGFSEIPTRVCEVAQPKCFLYRTNAGAIGRLMKEFEAGRKGHLIGGTKEVINFCKAALDLQTKRSTNHPELGCFANWAEVQEYVKEPEGKDLKVMVKMIDTFGAQKIINALQNMPKEEDADVIMGTAHRSKGREWPSVQLGEDFPTKNRMSDAERRLLYVAATRAQEELDVSKCPTFIGGIDEEGKRVAGLKINFTIDSMPSVEDLTAYRARKAGPKTAPHGLTSGPNAAPAVPTSTAPIPPQNATQRPANGNGGPALATQSAPEFIWRGINGKWMLCGPKGYDNQLVIVTKRNGTTSKERLGACVGELSPGSDKYLYEKR